MPMFRERRTSLRRVVDCPGSIVFGTNAEPRDCLIADISDGGARLVAPAGLPEEFALTVKDGSEVNHRCRVVWRLDDEIVVEFI